MKKLFLSVVVTFVFIFTAATSHAITIGFDFQSVFLGDSVDVEVVISGLGDFSPDSLGTFDMNISYDPTVLGFSGVTFGDPILGDQLDLFDFGMNFMGEFSFNGLVNIYEISFDLPDDLNSLQASTFTLATLSFDALAVGTSSLIYNSVMLGDSWGEPLMVAMLESGEVDVAPVPEPATLLLLVSGLIGIIGLNRNKSNS